jgi:hypothetical protein
VRRRRRSGKFDHKCTGDGKERTVLFFVEDLLLLWVVVFVTLMVTSPMLDERQGRNKPSRLARPMAAKFSGRDTATFSVAQF